MQPLRLQDGELWRSSPVQGNRAAGHNLNGAACASNGACAQHDGLDGQRLGFLLEEHDTPGTVEACNAAN